jgi:hypothetical protein
LNGFAARIIAAALRGAGFVYWHSWRRHENGRRDYTGDLY